MPNESLQSCRNWILEVFVPMRKSSIKKRQQYAKRNLLEREFVAERPNQIWVSDITYFRVNNYWVYLCIILDLYARRIVGYRVSRNASTNLVTATFRNAYQERGKPTNLTFHSDRGKQYTSAAFTLLLQKNRVKQSFSATGRPHDNAVAETFFATFKKEEAYRREYTSESKAFSKALSNTFNSIMKFVRTKHSSTRRRRPLKRSTMPLLSKMGVQIASWNENNTFSFRDFLKCAARNIKKKALIRQGFPKSRSPFFDKKCSKNGLRSFGGP